VMTRLLIVSLLFGIFHATPAQTQVGAVATAAVTAPAKPLSAEQQIRKTVGFIKMTCISGDKTVELKGTGFFVSYPDHRIGENGGFNYLVTNRHLAECWDDDRRPRTVQKVDLTLNLKEGSSNHLTNVAGNVPWILPADTSVDLALIPMLPDQSLYDYIVISASDFVDDDAVLSEGDRIMLSGFFYQFPGVRKMQPIVREGILAMLPDEDLTTTTGKPGKVYLADVHIFGGNSGSPVLVNLGGIRRGMIGGDSYRMVGVVSGMYYEDTDFNLQIVTTLTGTSHGNSGIAMIVPARQLKALLDDPRVQARRDAEVPIFLKQQTAQKEKAQNTSPNNAK
jgi:Trypsin-like peptidase domain